MAGVAGVAGVAGGSAGLLRPDSRPGGTAAPFPTETLGIRLAGLTVKYNPTESLWIGWLAQQGNIILLK